MHESPLPPRTPPHSLESVTRVLGRINHIILVSLKTARIRDQFECYYHFISGKYALQELNNGKSLPLTPGQQNTVTIAGQNVYSSRETPRTKGSSRFATERPRFSTSVICGRQLKRFPFTYFITAAAARAQILFPQSSGGGRENANPTLKCKSAGGQRWCG